MEDEEIQTIRRGIRTEIIVDRADVRLLTQQMADAYKLTQTAAKAGNKEANQQVYISYIIKERVGNCVSNKTLFLFLRGLLSQKEKTFLLGPWIVLLG